MSKRGKRDSLAWGGSVILLVMLAVVVISPMAVALDSPDSAGA